MSQVKTEQRRAEFLVRAARPFRDRTDVLRGSVRGLDRARARELAGVEAVKVNGPEGRVEVILSHEHPSLDQLVWSLKIVGFDDVQVLAFPNASPD